MGSKSSSNEPVITEDMRASARTAVNQWNDYQNRIVPFEKKYIAKVGSSDETSKMQGMVGADVAQKMGVAAIDPTRSGGASVNTGKVMANGMVEARASALDRKAAETANVVALGRGEQTNALDTMTQQAALSSQIATNKAIEDQKFATENRGLYMGMAGTAMGITTAGMMNAKTPAPTPTGYQVAPTATTGGYSTMVAPQQPFQVIPQR